MDLLLFILFREQLFLLLCLAQACSFLVSTLFVEGRHRLAANFGLGGVFHDFLHVGTDGVDVVAWFDGFQETTNLVAYVWTDVLCVFELEQRSNFWPLWWKFDVQ